MHKLESSSLWTCTTAHHPARILLAAIFISVVLVGFSGCAGMLDREAIQTERLLAAR